MDDLFEFTDAQMTATQEVLALWADLANVYFSLVVGPGQANVSFFDYYDKIDAAAASAIGNVAQGYDVGFNLANATGMDLAQGEYDRLTLIHEIGHALGLEHPGDYDVGTVNDPLPTYQLNRGYMEDSNQYAVMSYFGEGETDADFKGQFARTPLLHDIAAIQRLYGANMTTRTGSTTYGFNSNADREAFHIDSANEKAVFAIWDAGGTDTLNFSGYGNEQTIHLSSEQFSSVGGLKDNVVIAAGR
jgi:serralysin